MKFTKIGYNIIETNDNPWMLGGGISLLAGYYLINLLQEILKPELVHRSIVGLAIGFSLAFLGAAMFWKKSIFRFDIRSQCLIWRRRGV